MSKAIAIVGTAIVAGFLANHCLVIQDAAKRQAKAAESQGQLADMAARAAAEAELAKAEMMIQDVIRKANEFEAEYGYGGHHPKEVPRCSARHAGQK